MITILGDVTKEEDCARAVSKTCEKFGKFNTLILAAGLAQQHMKLIDVKDMKNYLRVMEVNFNGIVLVKIDLFFVLFCFLLLDYLFVKWFFYFVFLWILIYKSCFCFVLLCFFCFLL